jgi:uncharacterized protein YggE
MRIRSVRRLVVLGCLTLTCAAPALAQEGIPESFRRFFESLPTARLPEVLGLARAGLVAMDGEGSVRVRPDAARIQIGVTSEGASPTDVARSNAVQMSSVVDAIKKAAGETALASGAVEIRTDAVTLTPVYAVDQGPPRGRPTVSGYRASNSVRITIRELDQRGPGFLASLVEEANKAGANEISGPAFLVLNDAKPLVEARVSAIEDARTKAETYAKALNVRLGRVLAVTEADRGARPMAMMSRSAAQSDAAPPIEPGTNKIEARVTVMWELKQD